VEEAAAKNAAENSEEETVEIVGACKLMDGFFLGDAICAEVCKFSIIIRLGF
jgi:hypothetical protein